MRSPGASRLACALGGSPPGDLAAHIAALTHRGEAVDAAALGSTIIQLLAEGQSVDKAIQLAQQRSPLRTPAVASPLTRALKAAGLEPGQRATLAKLAPDRRAVSALTGGVYVAASFPDRERVRDALLFAASAGDGGHSATVAGALLGAAHGVDALPVDWLSRFELTWVADTLARDLVREILESPGGADYTEGTDARWTYRYPGW